MTETDIKICTQIVKRGITYHQEIQNRKIKKVFAVLSEHIKDADDKKLLSIVEKMLL